MCNFETLQVEHGFRAHVSDGGVVDKTLEERREMSGIGQKRLSSRVFAAFDTCAAVHAEALCYPSRSPRTAR